MTSSYCSVVVVFVVNFFLRLKLAINGGGFSSEKGNFAVDLIWWHGIWEVLKLRMDSFFLLLQFHTGMLGKIPLSFDRDHGMKFFSFSINGSMLKLMTKISATLIKLHSPLQSLFYPSFHYSRCIVHWLVFSSIEFSSWQPPSILPLTNHTGYHWMSLRREMEICETPCCRYPSF